ncbi:sulfotransferase (plasmid) [Azospirillum sp. A26]|uniref:sulfotransferase n=1 Tax=Azospirillum sp. A26 TaxID=3160607 RepID=UPI00366AD692
MNEKEVKKEIFIIGHARSGTTILCDILNSDRNVFLLKEGEIYWRTELPHFPDFFNRKGASQNRTWLKGHYLPPCIPPSLRGDQVLTELAKFYPRVGDKIALGPRRPEQLGLWEHFAKNYFHADYVFTIRHPLQAIVSMHRMFPANAYGDLIDTWLEAVSLMIRFMSFLPNVYVIPMERYSDRVLERLNGFLGTEAVVAGASLRAAASNGLDALPGLSKEDEDRIERCGQIYRDLYDSWDENSLKFYYHRNFYDYFEYYTREISAVMSPVQSQSVNAYPPVRTFINDPRRAVLAAYAECPLPLPEWQEIAEDYVKAFPEDGYGHYILALMLMKQADHQENALRHFDEALRIGYDPFWIKYNRAHLYKQINKCAEAIIDLQDAIALRGSHEGAQNMLNSLLSENTI